MNEAHVDMLAQMADSKAREFAGKLGDQPLTMNWVSRYNGFFSGYMVGKADKYTEEKSAEILKNMKIVTTPKVLIPPSEPGEDFSDLLGVDGEDLLG